MNSWNARTFLIALVLALGSSTGLASQSARAPLSYDLNVKIDPSSGTLRVSAKMDVPLERTDASSVKFNLHETFRIDKMQVNGQKATFNFAAAEDVFPLPASHAVVVALPPGTVGNRVQVNMEYQGQMKVLPEFGASSDFTRSLDDQINARMVELANYSSWYPQFGIGKSLDAQMELSLPVGWISVCSGRKLEEKVEGGRAISRWSSPGDKDILILASPHYKKKSAGRSGITIEIYYTELPEEFVARSLDEIAGAIQLFTERLGTTSFPGGTVKQVYSPKRKGQGKAGIARPGMIVTSEGWTLQALARDPKFSQFQGIAHEMAHSWWNFGVGQGDWINEAFAEYYSAIAVGKISSDDDFRAILKDYRAQVGALPANAPSLASVPFLNDPVGFVVRYYKGALMLHCFHEALGDEKFFKASHDFFQTYRGKAAGTAEFRAFWRERLVDQGKLLESWLDSTGGLPDEPKYAASDHEIQSSSL